MQEIILFEDSSIIAVRKEAGMAVQTARTSQTDLVSLLRNYLKTPEVYVIHRLDQPVAGVLVFAKTKRAAAVLSQQIQDGTMRKYYRAIVQMGKKRCQPRETGELCDYIIKDSANSCAKVVTKETAGAKRALLSYEVITADADTATLRIQLHTGRFHQIRVQLSHAGWPIIGDAKYGYRYTGAEMIPRGSIALTADELVFCHPDTGREIKLTYNSKL